MALLDQETKNALMQYLTRLAGPIELVTALDDSERGRQLAELVQEIVAAGGGKVTVREAVGEEVAGGRRPAFAVTRPGEAPRVHFAGLPLGHEFGSLILALLQVSGYPPKVEPDVIEQIKSLDSPLHFEVYVSLSCHNCPEVVQSVNTMAALNPNVQAVMIDGASFPAEVEAKQIMAVPTVYLNGELFGQGRMELPEILAKVDTQAEARDRARLAQKGEFDILIVGGGPAGAAAAIYAARKGLRTGIVAERFGGQVMDTLAIENFISVKETEGPKLVAGLEEHVKAYDVDIMNHQRAVRLDVPAEAGKTAKVALANGAELSAKAVILATGARWRELGVPGEKEYRGRGVAYCPHCDGPLFKGKKVAVIGGGNSGVEAAIDLAGIVEHVTLIEFADALRADAVLQRKLRSLPNVTIVTNAQTTEILGDGAKVNALRYRDRATGEEHTVELAGVFVQIGLVPNTDWLEGAVARNRFGEIEIDARCTTSAPGVFAAGDCTTVPYKQIIIAMGEGAKAALSAFDYLIRLAPAQ
jgi:alkyl hydroperoxide reductase subunit F